MINYIWSGMILISLVCSIITGRTSQLSESILSGAEESIKLVISILGIMCLWTGLMNIADEGGITKVISKILFPILKKLFPDYNKDSKAMRAICLNVAANILGLGNAATPFGIQAMKEMQKENKIKEKANNSMIIFIVINTASLQLIPTLLTVLRQKHGSDSPLDVLPAIWATSIISLCIGIVSAKLLENRGKKH